MSTGDNEAAGSASVTFTTEKLAEHVASLRNQLQSMCEASERANSTKANFAERLLLLDGGTIALTFTVIGIIGQHLASNRVICTYLLFSAWWLLVFSMGLCLLCQLSGTLLSIAESHIHALLRIGIDLNGINQVFQRAGKPAVGVESLTIISDWENRIKEVSELGKPLVSILAISVASTVLAFVLFLIFVQINAGVLISGGK